VPKGVAYFTGHGFRPAGHMRVDPGRKWRDVPPCDLYLQGMAFEQDAENLYRQMRTRCDVDADGVLSSGAGPRKSPSYPQTRPASGIACGCRE
jgi:maleate isomerase